MLLYIFISLLASFIIFQHPTDTRQQRGRPLPRGRGGAGPERGGAARRGGAPVQCGALAAARVRRAARRLRARQRAPPPREPRATLSQRRLAPRYIHVFMYIAVSLTLYGAE